MPKTKPWVALGAMSTGVLEFPISALAALVV
jgi:O-acetyl-ADP-ribose deacetylase (regulator of RNase III)